MNALAPVKVGWCPGALRPMETGDGWVVRLKPSGGRLSLPAAAAVAELASRYGSGEIDLTARANLQIRGVAADRLPPLSDELRALELVDADAGAEAIRNIVASPLAGLGASAGSDMHPVLAALEVLLATDPDLRRLPAKWSFVVDDGGPLSLADVAADVRFEAMVDGSLQVGLADDPCRADCAPDKVAEVALALCRVALEAGSRRMGEIVRERSAVRVLTAVGLAPMGALARARPSIGAQDLVGVRAVGTQDVFGAAPAFGGLRAEELNQLAQSAGEAGARALWLTPWRVVLVPCPSGAGAKRLGESLSGTDLITAPDDPRLAVAACSGLPGCRRASTAVRADAARLARSLPGLRAARGIALHVSGCAKGCAHPQDAPWTLVGHDGYYDLVADGRTGDLPLARGLDAEAAQVQLGGLREADGL